MILAYAILFMALIVIFSAFFADLTKLGKHGSFYFGLFTFIFLVLVITQQVKIVVA